LKLHYYPETGSLYVEFQGRPSVDTSEVAPDVRLDLDEHGRPVGLDIDRASEILDLDTPETAGLPSSRRARPRAGSQSLEGRQPGRMRNEHEEQ
jgi:uncharacterized protein YuzE